MGATRRFVYNGSGWDATKEEKDITANVSINGWTTTGSAQELTYTLINFGAGVLPSDLGYHILDNDIVDDNTGSASSDDVVSGTTSDDDNSSSSGCFGTVSGASVAVVGILAVALLKKKENE